MANNIIDISLLNPIRFVNLGGAFKHFDDDWFSNMIRGFEDPVTYGQKWQTDDTIKLQFYANFTPISVAVLDCSGNTLSTYNATLKATDLQNPDFKVYENSISLAGLSAGTYYLLLTAGTFANETQMISEPMQIAENWEDTILFTYSNSQNTQGVYFETGIVFTFRAEAIISDFLPGFKDTLYQDQILDNVLLDSIPYREFKLLVGGIRGIPDWVVDKVNRILSCDKWQADGKEFVKKDGTQWTPIRLDRYPMSGWSIDILEADVTSSKRGSNTGNPVQQIAVVYDIETKLFGTFNDLADNNTVQITEIE